MKWLGVLLGILLLVGSVNAVYYGVSYYPPGQNFTYVNATGYNSASFYPYFATDPTLSLTGSLALNGWETEGGVVTNQRFHIDLGSAKKVNLIYYENFMHLGTLTDRGVQHFTFWGSNTSGSFLNKTYTNDTGWTQLTTSVAEFTEHTASDVADPQFIDVTNTGSYRYYAFKFADNWGSATVLGVRRLELQERIAWVYTTPGTYYWVCPTNVTTVSVNIGAGGGSGKGAYSSSGYWIGYGGSTGEWKNYASVSVTPGTNYTIVVGAGGAASLADAVSNAGSLSSAFTYSAAGGAGGLSLPKVTNSNGGDGSNGFLVGGNAAAGGTASIYTGGLAGSGYSAGGGGGAAQSGGSMGAGGKGSDGYVGITQSGYSTLNAPDFTGTPLTGIAGTLVTFTDTSTIVDNTNMTYLWDFGDGSTSSTKGDVVHVFPYVGSYTVKLTIHTDLGDVEKEKEAYVNLVNEQTELNLVGQPSSVTFHTQTFFGAPIVGANVSIVGISTSTGNWDWVVNLLGIPLDESAINSTSMYQTTDSLGNAEFLMIPSIKYNVSTTMAGYSFPVFYVAPHDKSYTLVAALNASEMFGPPSGKSNITVLVNATKINGTAGYVNFTFNDTANSTTGGLISLYRDNATAGGARVLIKTFTVPNSSFFNSTNVTLLSTGTVFTVSTNATSSLESGRILRDSVVSFIGNPVAIGYFDSTILLWFAISIIILTGLMAGATAAPQISAICCIEAWIFLGMGWLNPLVASQGVAVVASISLATFLSAVWLLAEGRRAER